MSINIYWACGDDEWIRASEPEKVSKRFYNSQLIDIKNPESSLNHCPAFNRSLNNLYAIKSMYDYSFTMDGDVVKSNMYDQKFFDEHVFLRSIENKFASFKNQYIFFTDEDSLEITAYEYPVFEQNEITKRCITVPGKYDIGKWFRPLEFPFILKNGFDEFHVNHLDVLYYLRFHTDQSIEFKQFIVTDKIRKILNSNTASTINISSRFKTLDNFYNIFKSKKYLLKEIKENLI
jgi:hypothetical protein